MSSNLKLSLSLFIAYLFFSYATVAQKKFMVTIQLPDNVEKEKIQFFYDVGNGIVWIDTVLIGNEIVLSDSFYSKYASIEMNYPKEDGTLPYYYKGFYVTDKPATIIYQSNNSTGDPFKKFKAINAYEIGKMGANKMEAFTSEEAKDFWSFYNKNVDSLGSSSLLATKLSEKNKALFSKMKDFVVQNPNLYYSFWLFRRKLAPNNLINADSLLKTYNIIFSDSLKKSREGQKIEEILNGRNLDTQSKAPNFNIIDITGKEISLDQYIGKFVLLNFWASWCKPCIEHLPAIKEIRDTFEKEKLEVIFITLDNDTTTLFKSLDKYNINYGHHIFSNKTLLTDYGVQPIPRLFLVDSNGMIIYNRQDDPQLRELNKILREGYE
jgi:thiol-disulfide isomerase/thioredoxin